ncbi:hypothetical protein lerEdw1_000659 [Lerista edwardsae]|nr:hypothetical protein lerEdw1_000659 [Lerista edwardsae]
MGKKEGKKEQPGAAALNDKEPSSGEAGAAMPKKQAGAAEPKTAGLEEEARHTCCGCRFPLLLALLQLALGASVIALGVLMAIGSASLPVRDTPYWAGVLVCVVAILGLVMLCVSYQPDEKTCVQFSIKVAYFLLCALSLVVCILAVAFASYRYSQITQFSCETVLETCQCKLDTVDPLSRTFIYEDVTDCTAITGTFSLYLLIQIVLNLLAAIVGFAACFVMWKDRYQIFYVGIRLQSLTTTGVQQQKV